VKKLRQEFSVTFSYPVIFTRDIFSTRNDTLPQLLEPAGCTAAVVVADAGLLQAAPGLHDTMRRYLYALPGISLREIVVVPGGEEAKRGERIADRIREIIHRYGLCRHSHVIAVGGGAVLDAAGYAAATAHRGVKLIRVPTTVLSQSDAGVGIKNGANAFGSKNFLGTFTPPAAVVNDSDLLRTLPSREVRAGMAEAVKVAVIKDSTFFRFLESRSGLLAALHPGTVEQLIERCAEIHLEHIRSGGDPFERGSARPLDFGHWSAHRLEELTGGELRHGEGVAVGIALDCEYAEMQRLLSSQEKERVLAVLRHIGLPLSHPALAELNIPRALEDFRRHLGGHLSVTLPRGIGAAVQVARVDVPMMEECRRTLLRRERVDEQ
jgi:3-dehydroquinate synthase